VTANTPRPEVESIAPFIGDWNSRPPSTSRTWRTRAENTELKASHLAMLSHPAEVAALIERGRGSDR
jgi:hypothetical protein